MQYVEVKLDPGESAVGKAGGMKYMQDGIQMDTVFGDGSQQQGWIHGEADGRRQAAPDRGKPVHDRFP